jgi:hypothetical protein
MENVKIYNSSSILGGMVSLINGAEIDGDGNDIHMCRSGLAPSGINIGS